MNIEKNQGTPAKLSCDSCHRSLAIGKIRHHKGIKLCLDCIHRHKLPTHPPLAPPPADPAVTALAKTLLEDAMLKFEARTDYIMRVQGAYIHAKVGLKSVTKEEAQAIKDKADEGLALADGKIEKFHDIIDDFVEKTASDLDVKTHCCECTPGEHNERHLVHIQYPDCKCNPEFYIKPPADPPENDDQ